MAYHYEPQMGGRQARKLVAKLLEYFAWLVTVIAGIANAHLVSLLRLSTVWHRRPALLLIGRAAKKAV